MKKMFVIYSLLSVSTIMLAGCGRCCKKDVAKQVDVADQIKDEGTMHMARKKTDSGLEYEITQEGSGVSPQPGQRVTVHYTGWLDENGERGSKFDSSVDRGEPFTFVVGIGQVIAGWDEGVIGMKVGEKRRLVIPSNLGYGARGAGNVIPPHATLIFDVELLNVA